MPERDRGLGDAQAGYSGEGHGQLSNVGCRPDEKSTVVGDTHGLIVSSPANAGRSSIEETRWMRMREHCAREAPRDYELLLTSSRVQWWSVTQNLCMAGHAYGLDHLKDALGPREARNRSLGRDQSDSNDHQN